MAQHIINIAFDFDDDKVRQTAENAVDKELHNIVEEVVLNRIAPYDSYWYNVREKKERDWSRLNNKIDNEIRSFLDEHKEEIMNRAASKLANSVQKTKAWKEKRSEIIEE